MKQPHKYPQLQGLTWTLIFIMTASIIGITSAQAVGQYGETNFAVRQAIWYGIGFVVIIAAMQVDPEHYRKFAPLLYGIGVLLLLAIALAPESIAPVRNGAKRWFELPVIGSVQPSEVMKTFYIFMMAYVISKHNEKRSTSLLKGDVWLLVKMVLTSLVPAALIVTQPDLGTTLVFVGIAIGMLVMSGVTWKLIVPGFAVAAGAMGSFLYAAIYRPDLLQMIGIQPYQLGRIYAWLDPHTYQSAEGYNLLQAMLAIGSGEMTGKGYQGGQVYIPEHHTDFIFTVFGEEYGFIGTSIVVSLFLLLIYYICTLALKSKDTFSIVACTGIVSMIAFQVFQNIAMTIQLMPITGLTLPFISYGGSSLLVMMFALGFVYSVGKHQKDFAFEGTSEHI